MLPGECMTILVFNESRSQEAFGLIKDVVRKKSRGIQFPDKILLTWFWIWSAL